MTNARLIENWLSQPDDVGHSLHVVGARLMFRDETQGVRYTHDGRQIVVLSTACDLARSAFPPEVKVFGVNPRDARNFFNFFDRDWMVCRGIREPAREIDAVYSALNSELYVPLPPKLIRAERGLAIGRNACALLAFFDSYVPARFRYAMPRARLDIPRNLVGSMWTLDEFVVFESDEDAIAAKMGCSQATYIIDLHGTDEVLPPPLPQRLDDDDSPF